MLHDRHDLNGIVSQRLDAGQRIIDELPIAADSLLFLRHTDVALVDKGVLGGGELPVFPFVRRLVHDHPAPGVGVLVLQHSSDVKGDPFKESALLQDDRLHVTAVVKGVLPLQIHLPHPVFKGGQGQAEAIPMHHIAGKIHSVGTGCPLSVDPAAVGAVEAEILVAVGKVAQGAILSHQLGLFAVIVLHPLLDIGLVGQESGIVLKDLILCGSLLVHTRLSSYRF